MPRKNNWPAALALFFEEKRHQPFAWGKNDCALFAADWLAILMGTDYAAAQRGTYDTALGAARLLQERGGLEGIVDATGYARAPVAFARRGDLVLFDMPDGPTLGVCAGKHSVFAGGECIVAQLTAACRIAWRIE